MDIGSEKGLMLIEELFDDVPASIAVLRGRQYVIEYANKVCKKTVRQTKNIVGLMLKDAMPEIIDLGIFEILDNVYNTGSVFAFKEFHARVDVLGNGEPENKYFSLFFKPIRDEQKNIVGIFVHAIEISDLVETRIAAEKSKIHFENMIMNAPVATALYAGQNMVIELANEKMISLWGKDKSVINKKLIDALPELKDQPFLKILHDVYTTGNIYNAIEQKAILEVEGKLLPFWFNFTYKPLFNEEGKVYAILNMALDVTYQVEAKKKLADAEEKLRSAIEVANLGTWEYNIVTGKHYHESTIDGLAWIKIDRGD